MTHHDDVTVGLAGPAPVGGEQLLAGGRDAHVDLGQRLAASGTEVTVGLPLLPDVGRDVAERLALELAVVDLDPAVVDDDGEVETEELRRVDGAASGLARSSTTGRSSSVGTAAAWARRAP